MNSAELAQMESFGNAILPLIDLSMKAIIGAAVTMKSNLVVNWEDGGWDGYTARAMYDAGLFDALEDCKDFALFVHEAAVDLIAAAIEDKEKMSILMKRLYA